MVTNELELGGGGLLLLQNHVWKVDVSMGGALPQRYLATRWIYMVRCIENMMVIPFAG